MRIIFLKLYFSFEKQKWALNKVFCASKNCYELKKITGTSFSRKAFCYGVNAQIFEALGHSLRTCQRNVVRAANPGEAPVMKQV